MITKKWGADKSYRFDINDKQVNVYEHKFIRTIFFPFDHENPALEMFVHDMSIEELNSFLHNLDTLGCLSNNNELKKYKIKNKIGEKTKRIKELEERIDIFNKLLEEEYSELRYLQKEIS